MAPLSNPACGLIRGGHGCSNGHLHLTESGSLAKDTAIFQELEDSRTGVLHGASKQNTAAPAPWLLLHTHVGLLTSGIVSRSWFLLSQHVCDAVLEQPLRTKVRKGERGTDLGSESRSSL